MKAIELLEARLAEGLQAFDDAAGYVREAEEIDTKKNLRLLGHAISSGWEVREEVYKFRPDLKPNFLREVEENSVRYDELDKLFQLAYSAEKNKDLDKAESHYNNLREISRRGYFLLVAEAGLYRISEAKKNKNI